MVHRDLASLYLLNDRYEEARGLLAGAVRRHASDAALHSLLGAALEGLGDVNGALDALRTGVQLGSDDPRAWQLYATLLHGQGLLDQAIDAYERVRELWGEPPQTNLGLGLAYFENGQYRDAGEALERVLKGDWENAVAHFYLGHLYADYLGKPEEARDLLGRYFELGGNDSRARNWLDRLGR